MNRVSQRERSEAAKWGSAAAHLLCPGASAWLMSPTQRERDMEQAARFAQRAARHARLALAVEAK